MVKSMTAEFLTSHACEMLRGCCAAMLRVVSQVSGADMARPNPAQGKLSCESS